MMQVRTFAEEVYTQLVAGVDVARAVAVSLPAIVLGAFLVFIVVRAWDRTLPPLTLPGREAVVFRLGRWRFPAAVLLGIVGGVLLWIPLGSLCSCAGEGGSSWSMRTLVQHLGMTRRAESWTLLQSLLVAVVAGVACAGWAAVVCWTCLDRRRWQAGLLIFLACVWAIPGPIIGLGLKDTLRAVTESSDSSLVNVLLWRGPSPLPLVWVEVIRFFPCAVALLWPVMRLTPPELRASAVTDGATPGQELALVVWPFHLRDCRGGAGRRHPDPGRAQRRQGGLHTRLAQLCGNDLDANALRRQQRSGGPMLVALGDGDRGRDFTGAVCPRFRSAEVVSAFFTTKAQRTQSEQRQERTALTLLFVSFVPLW